MGDYYEGRASCCYICKFFIQNEAQYRNGVCVKHPPQKIDENLGGAVAGAPAGFKIFPNILDTITGFCGDFEMATIMPTDADDPPDVYKDIS